MGNEWKTALRSLRRRPGFAAVAVLTLALGIGANAGLYSVVHAVLLAPLPFPEPHRLVHLWESDGQRTRRNPSPADFLDVRRQASSFLDLAAYDWASGNLTDGGDPEPVTYALVSGSFFRTLGVAPSLGRTFGPGPAEPGELRAVLADGFWRRRYGGDPAVVGRTLRLDGRRYEIVGVMPAGFTFPEAAELWATGVGDIPVGPDFPGDAVHMRDAWFHQVVGRLAPGVTLQGADAELQGIARRLARAYPGPDADLGLYVTPLRDDVVGAAAPLLWLLLGATGLVLLVACANVGNLVLARGLARRAELSLRSALGAGAGRIALLVLAECAVLAAVGGAVGLVLAAVGLHALEPVTSAVLPRAGEIRVDASVLGYTVAASVFTALLASLFPVRAALGVRGTAGTARAGRGRGAGAGAVGDGLVAAQAALAVVLVLGTGLLLRSARQAAGVDLGFRTDGLSVAWVGRPGARSASPEEKAAFFREIEDRLSPGDGTRSVAWTQVGPLSTGPGAGLRIFERPELGAGGGTPPGVRWQVVSAEYFSVAGIPLRSGRAFTDEDRPESPPVGIVNESLARMAFPADDPIGKRINTGLDGRDADGDWRWVTVVGVVADTRNRGPTEPAEPVLFRPLRQGGPGFDGSRMLLVVRDQQAPGAVGAEVRRAVHDVDAAAPVYGVARGADLARRFGRQRGLLLGLLGAFGTLALGLGAVGSYGMAAFSVGRRTRELGVRVALGARRRSVLFMVLREGLRPTLLGALLGLVLAVPGSRWLTAYLFQVDPLDLPTYLAVPAILIAASTVALLLPAVRASGTDPAVALRDP